MGRLVNALRVFKTSMAEGLQQPRYKVAPCPNCTSDDLRATTADASSHLGPDLLPGAHAIFDPGTLEVVVCCNCGLTRFFASHEEVERLLKSARWHT